MKINVAQINCIINPNYCAISCDLYCATKKRKTKIITLYPPENQRPR